MISINLNLSRQLLNQNQKNKVLDHHLRWDLIVEKNISRHCPFNIPSLKWKMQNISFDFLSLILCY
jgi:hypothetical protein